MANFKKNSFFLFQQNTLSRYKIFNRRKEDESILIRASLTATRCRICSKNEEFLNQYSDDMTMMLATRSKHFLLTQFFEYISRSSLSRRYRATLIDGKSIAQKILDELKSEIVLFESKCGRKPLLTCILVGDNSASLIYVKNKIRAAEKVGIETNVVALPSSISERDLVAQIHELNEKKEVDGVLLQLPLPAHVESNVCNEICSEKDVDGFTSSNLGKLFLNSRTFIPCTALAVHRILVEIGIDIRGKHAVICGRSKHVGLPIAMLLHSNVRPFDFNATTTICHRFTPANQLTRLCREADLIISATGVPSLIRGEMVKKDAVVIDVGITRIVDPKSGKSRIVGDVHFEEVAEVASYITPVPGGVGPLTVAMVIHNTLKAAQQRSLRQLC